MNRSDATGRVHARPLRSCAAVLLLAVFCVPAPAAQRVALVIGNAAYAHAPVLANSPNDAAAVGDALARLGFDVIPIENASEVELRRALRRFSLAASTSEVALVFYAGHGIEVDQRNYLVPVDARLASDRDVDFEAVPLELVQRAVEPASGLRLVILDACRENPFVAKMQRAGATRSMGRGLARVEPSGETLIAYAAKEGTLAADGAGRHSPYTQALLAHLEEPGLEVGLMFRRVRDAVLASTGGRQEPFVYGSLSSRGVYLAAGPAPGSAPPSGGPAPVIVPGAAQVTAELLAAEREFWASVKASADPAELRAYVDRYPNGTYVALARARLKRLQAAAESADAVDAVEARPGVEVAASAVSVPAPAESAPEEVESSLGLERVERRRVQQGLASLGYGPGPADGLFGARTRDAIRRYQGAKGFEATGYLSAEESEALVAMGEEAARAQAEAARREAQRRADDAAFAQAKSAGTVEAYGTYLSSYPAGGHAVEARRLRGEAERLERERREKAPGRRFRDCEGCPELVVVASGSFRMGSRVGEDGRDDDEGPVHRVHIAEPFAVGVYEVTFAQWDACRREGGCTHNPGDAGWGRGNRPVMSVSWEDAQEYVAWLSRKTGERYRLLSESEWEYVARAGTTTPFHFGTTVSTEQANYDGNHTYGSGRKGRYRKRTEPVGSFPANAFGLYDVHGNVMEWVEDCWNGGYTRAPTDGSAWESGECSRRVLRGGSWKFGPWFLRSAYRKWFTAGSRYYYAGFRVARTLK